MLESGKLVDQQTLRALYGVSGLNPDDFMDLAARTHVETQPAGRRLFIRGREDQWIYYLLDGEVRLEIPEQSGEIIRGGSADALKPLADEQPRRASAVCLTPVSFIRIDRNLLEVLSHSARSDSYLVKELTADDADLHNRLFFSLYRDYMADALKLPQLPDVALKVKRIADDPDGDIRAVARVIQHSPVLSGKLINLTNSAFYHPQMPVDSCLGAVTQLGMYKTRDLVITYTMRNLFRTRSSVIDKCMQRLWRHSALTGAVSYALADMTPGLGPDRALLLGLLHDIGVVPIISYAEQFPQIAHNMDVLDEVIHALRAQMGAMVLRQWGFADETVQVCMDADNWQRDPGKRPDYTDAVLVAQRLADTILDKRPAMEAVLGLPAFHKLARGRLADEEALDTLLSDAQDEIASIFELN